MVKIFNSTLKECSEIPEFKKGALSVEVYNSQLKDKNPKRAKKCFCQKVTQLRHICELFTDTSFQFF